MKIFLLSLTILLVIFIVFQIYTSMSTIKSEMQPYKIIKAEKSFEIRHYPAANMAIITAKTQSYRDLGYTGFRTLANYIFGGNKDKKQIAMTSPVHMDIGDSVSTMAFAMPSDLQKENLPIPDNQDIIIRTTQPEYVAALRFGGFANTKAIQKYSQKLKTLLDEKGISYTGNVRFLGYNPPYQIFGRRNEVIVTLHSDDFL
jgi:hypothetical protein